MPEDFLIPPGVTVVRHPLIEVKLTQLRDTQTRAPEFRRRMAEIAALLLFEATRALETRPCRVISPLAECDGVALARPIVIAPILRAGLGMLEGMMRLLPDASVAHIGLRRDEVTHRPHSYYFRAPPNLSGAEVLVVDPMLATGFSATEAVDQLKKAGARAIQFVGVVSCPQGIEQLTRAHPDVRIFTAVIDPALDQRAYIVPGLGDAGDRFFGTDAVVTESR
ncbi:MAG: uracil phosphoribosyltransferase [Verrucomicrobiota bacterium]|nr:uracil phosphoribosyltransferase [Verrucomicrobiota bacterium]